MERRVASGIMLTLLLIGTLTLAFSSELRATGQANDWWNINWEYRVPITITENSGFDLTDYQVLVSIDTASLIGQGKMRSDCGDIRFTDSNNIEIPYWFESCINTGDTRIRVKVPSIPASGTSTIYMYYGNPYAVSVSNGDTTFEFFDDFDAGLGKWTNFGSPSPITFESDEFHDGWGYSTNGDGWYPSGSYSNTLVDITNGTTVEVRLKVADGWSDWDYLGIGMGSLQTGYDDRTTLAEAFFMIHASGAQYPSGLEDVIAYHNPWWDHPTTAAAYIEPNDFAWHRYTIKYDPSTGNATYYQDGIFKWNNSTGPMPFDSLPIVMYGRDVTDTNFLDYVFVRKYAEPEPTIVIGPEETLAITATVDIDPDTLNLKSRGKWVTAYIELPEGYNVSDIDVSSIVLNNTVPAELRPTAIGDYDEDGIPDLMVKFERAEVTSYILANVNLTELFEEMFMTIILTVTGELENGTLFQGSDTFRIMRPSIGRPGLIPV